MIEKILLGAWARLKARFLIVLIICQILVFVFGYAASWVAPETALETNVRKGSKDYNTLMTLKNTFSDQSIIALVRGKTVEDVMSPQNMEAMRYMLAQVKESEWAPKIQFTLSPTFMIDYMEQAGQYDPTQQTPAEFISDPVTGAPINDQFKSFFMTRGYMEGSEFDQYKDDIHALVIYGMWKSWDAQETGDFIKAIKRWIKEANFDENVYVQPMGLPLIMDFMATELPKILGTLMGIGGILMLIVLTFGFRVLGKFTRRWLTLALVVVSIIYTLGICGFLDIPLTNASVVVFPILLGLGVDYCLQFHNRYDEEVRKGVKSEEAAKQTLVHVGPPIIMAMLLCIFGFASVFIVAHQQIFYFGMTLIIGVAVCMVVALMLLLGILNRLDEKGDATRKPQPRPIGPLEKLMSWSVNHIVKWAIPLVIVGVIFSGIGWWQESKLESMVGFDKAVKNDVPEYVGMRYMQKLAGGISPWNVIVRAEEGHSVLEPEIQQWCLEKSRQVFEEQSPANGGYIGAMASLPQTFDERLGGIPASAEEAQIIVTSMLPREAWINLVNEDFTALSLGFTNTSDGGKECGVSADAMEVIFNGPDNNRPDGIGVITVTGLSILGPIMDKAMDQSRTAIMSLGLGLIIAALLILFRFRIMRVIAAAFPILLVLGWSALFMRALDIKISMLSALLPAQMMAIGIEFTILLLMRYYEERDKGEDPRLAMTTAMSKIGRAILVSGGMVFVGFFVMIFAFNFPFIQEFGYVTMFDMLLIMLATLVVMPALVLTFDLRGKKGKATATAQKTTK